MNDKKNDPKMGWECPRCHKINAPWMIGCGCKQMKVIKKEIWRISTDVQL